MAINQISTANTFEEWLSTTSTLVAVANNLTDNTNGGFLANSSIFIEGSAASLNVRTHANINYVWANTANISNVSIIAGSVTGNANLTFDGATVNNLTFGNVVVTGNIQTVNVTTSLNVGGDAIISGNLRISGNTILDTVGFNDLTVSGNASVGNNLVVTQNIAVVNVTRTLNVGSSVVAPLANIANINLSFSSITVPETLTVNNASLTGNLFVANTTVNGNITRANVTTTLNVGSSIVAPLANVANINLSFSSITVPETLTVNNASITGNLFVANTTVNGNITRANVTTTLNVGSSIVAPSANIGTLNVTNGLILTGNIARANITSNLAVGGDTFIYGNLTITGNTTLDSIGFNDLDVAGQITSSNLNTTNANVTILSGQANTAIYGTITAAIESAIAFSIALG
jgi:hypothetical protein